MRVLKDWRKYPKAYNSSELLPNKIYRSWLPNKKLVILVEKNGKRKLLHFGDKRYTNWGIHKNKARLQSYLKRSAGIRDKQGRLTKNNPFSANYWSRKILWNSNLSGIGNVILY